MKKTYDTPEMEITKISFQAIMDNTMDTSEGEIGKHDGDEGLDE